MLIPFDFDDLCIFKIARKTSDRVDFYVIAVQINAQPMHSRGTQLRASFPRHQLQLHPTLNELLQPRAGPTTRQRRPG